YSINQNSWTPSVVSTSGELLQAIRAICDPLTGLVYINGADNMNIYNPVTNSLQHDAIPPETFMVRFFSGAIYNSVRRSIMYMGGLTGALQWEERSSITEYTITTRAWSTFATTGQIPTPRADHCMAVSEDGNTIVIFGGRIPTNYTASTPTNFTGTFYVLDVLSRTWTQEPPSSPRLYTACIIVGDQFLAWGGFDGVSTVSTTPIVFDLTKRQWVTSYTAPPNLRLTPKLIPTSVGSLPPPSSPSSSSSSISDPSSPNHAAILGGIFGVLRSDRVKYSTHLQQQTTYQDYSNKSMQSNFLEAQYPGGSPVRNPQMLKRRSFEASRNPQDGAAAMGHFSDPSAKQAPQQAVLPRVDTALHTSFNTPVSTTATPVSTTASVLNANLNEGVRATYAPDLPFYYPNRGSSSDGSDATVAMRRA
ncbi:hypothetical protein BGZ65_007264, partial [Modicella reniformis]